MKSFLRIRYLWLYVFFTLPSMISAANPTEFPTIRISVAQLPGLAENGKHGILIELLEELDALYPGQLKLSVVPFARSLRNVDQGIDDLHVPMIRFDESHINDAAYSLNQPSGELAKYRYSQVALFSPTFVLITETERAPATDNTASEPYIYTDHAHVSLFPCAQKGTSCIPCTLRMIAADNRDSQRVCAAVS